MLIEGMAWDGYMIPGDLINHSHRFYRDLMIALNRFEPVGLMTRPLYSH